MSKMIDTVKLLIPISDPAILSKGAFAPMTIEQLVNARGVTRTYLNPSPVYAKTGKYEPEWIAKAQVSDFSLDGYQHHPNLTTDMAI